MMLVPKKVESVDVVDALLDFGEFLPVAGDESGDYGIAEEGFFNTAIFIERHNGNNFDTAALCYHSGVGSFGNACFGFIVTIDYHADDFEAGTADAFDS